MSRQPTSVTAKFASEIDFFTVPFTLLSGETISTSAYTVNLAWGVDANPAAMKANNSSSSGNEVTFALQGGVAGNLYDIAVSITTNLGRALTNKLSIEVR